MQSLADVFQALLSVQPEWAQRIPCTQVTVDSRLVTPGSLFVALKGERQDGHEFVGDALQRGATAVLAERAYTLSGEARTIILTADQPMPPAGSAPVVLIVPSALEALQKLALSWRSRFPECRTIAITGSVGKSSTKELISSILQRHYRTLKSKGNYNNEIGLPLTLLQIDETCERAVVEMGMYAIGEIAALCRLAQPTIGLVTNVGPSHLERLGTIAKIAQAKSELVRALPEHGIAILNRDDALVKNMANDTRARVFYYGLDPESDLWADEITSFGLEGIAFSLHRDDERLRVHIPLLGRHSVHTALAATSVALVEGLDWDEIVSGLTDSSAQLRLIAVPAENGTTILDDTYNASPESSLAALNLLADLSGRKVAVLGDMLELGELEEQGHRVVGGRAAQTVSVLVTVGTRGRWIGEAAKESGLTNSFHAENNDQAIEILREVMKTGDLILVKGSRGAKMEEIVAALSRPGENGGTESK